jgi:hypothetical protein
MYIGTYIFPASISAILHSVLTVLVCVRRTLRPLPQPPLGSWVVNDLIQPNLPDALGSLP